MSNFANYELAAISQDPNGVFSLADGLLYDIGAAAQYELSDAPALSTEEYLSNLITRLGPAKELQRNIKLVEETLGTQAVSTTADWLERSGCLDPLDRAFKDLSNRPGKVDTVMWSGGVANWMLRRRNLTERIDPQTVGKIIIPAGSRTVNAGEHQLASTLHRRYITGTAPTEADFITEYVKPALKIAGFFVEVIPVDSRNGDEILDNALGDRPEILDGTVLVVGNAPNAIQATAQIRNAARRIDEDFDRNDTQLFMLSDTIPVARNGEPAATHQNPLTALGQIVRNALFLHQQS